MEKISRKFRRALEHPLWQALAAWPALVLATAEIAGLEGPTFLGQPMGSAHGLLILGFMWVIRGVGLYLIPRERPAPPPMMTVQSPYQLLRPPPVPRSLPPPLPDNIIPFVRDRMERQEAPPSA